MTKKQNPRQNLARVFDGGADRDRTDDLYTASVALSQLSYGPMISDDLLVVLRFRNGADYRRSLLHAQAKKQRPFRVCSGRLIGRPKRISA